ncbi:hypothetical protein COCSUDRAFT_59944 [Coccomyxa subellipsoidea C-169]|uniref:Selenoprotein H n=1 Tax=Coccomyxa subellipsoidea (strain C-169) TaxID=574566 RepID=I0YJR6_COCSC|nr:hypothetical protein COCSUDRAFT_59944 [Coccomyxa subellipsoidea C-169]EIE18635.1 hypothetical protein COCSUDRAFT_59944 [Coccomyxa subellipsoidea C-169]|eukprot:XP_005643179.1 hypothetical protein COCSUDRAFT_59944 [Coccomyxa subellipsoidea C-169]
MAPKRKAAAATASKAAASAPKKAKAAKIEKAIEAAPAAAGSSDGKNLSLIIEAWANKLEKALKEAVPDSVVVINPEKPRKGCFEVRDADSTKTYVSLLVRPTLPAASTDMPRPFTKLKALDIEALAQEIADGTA